MPDGQVTPMSASASDLGLGNALTNQVKDETDEERKRRIREAQARSMMGPAAQSLGLNPMASVLGGR